MKPDQPISQRRLGNHQITQGKFELPSQIVSWFGAMQAQDYASVKWAVGLRCAQTTDTLLEEEIAKQAIVRTWLMRGTLQIVAAPDIHWMLTLLSPRIVAARARRHQQLGLDDATLAKSHEILIRELEGGNRLTRKEVMFTLEQAGISTRGQRGYHILGHAALEGVICFGPNQGKEQTFVLLREWVLSSQKLESDEALAELARRYFQSHGPATLKDFVGWSGLRITVARKALELVKDEFQQETIAGQTCWEIPYETIPGVSSPTIHLLPAFDEYYLGYQDRGAVLDPHYDKTVVSSNGMFRPIIVLDGQVVGTWKRTLKKRCVIITANPFVSFAKKESQALLTAAERFGAFLGLPVELQVDVL
ncbi:MAG: winged helix DNA-binding domain-containing protein [Anaerolineae bacterium]